MNPEENRRSLSESSMNSLRLATQQPPTAAVSVSRLTGHPVQAQFGTDLFEQILDDLTDGVYSVDTEMRITYMNTAAGRISGYSPADSIGCRCQDNMLVHIDGTGKRLCNDGCPMKATLEDGHHRDALVYLKHKAGHRVPVELRIAPLHDDLGRRIGAVQVFNSANARFDLEQRTRRLEELAYRDTLTGLGSRAKGQETLDLCLYRRNTSGKVAGLLYIDIDHFKRVNDVYGHDTGDQVLKMVSYDIKAATRDEDVTVRWGGEEFLCILPDASDAALREVGDRIRTLTRLSYLEVEGASVSVTLSVGAALLDPDDTCESWLARADRRLYWAKSNGRDQLVVEDFETTFAMASASSA